jgi:hypothetical protein
MFMYVSCIGNSAGYKFAEAKILNVEGLGSEMGNTDLFQLTVTTGYICHWVGLVV